MDNFTSAQSSLHEFSDKSFDEILKEEEEKELNEKLQSGFHTSDTIHDKAITILNGPTNPGSWSLPKIDPKDIYANLGLLDVIQYRGYKVKEEVL